MRILFVCSCIEPGSDGVGDYTQKMCDALIKIGHEVSILAIYDSYVTGKINQLHNSAYFSYSTTRIGANTKYKQRFKWSHECITAFKPDWVSVQFVPFGFNAKGLPFWLPKFLAKLDGNYSWQIMFHELWIGRGKDTSLKNKIVSVTQEHIVKKLIAKLQPKVIHTHLPTYQRNLLKITNTIKPLPLFSNIEPVSNTVGSSIENRFRWAFFSQVSAAPEIIAFINAVNIQLVTKGIFTELVIIGGNKSKMATFVADFKQKCTSVNMVTCTGFLSEKEISNELSQSSLGITPVPRHAIGKSGTVAAFLAHGIPVAAPIFINNYEQDEIGFFDVNWIGTIITTPNLKEIEFACEVAQKYKKHFLVDEITKQLIKDLT